MQNEPFDVEFDARRQILTNQYFDPKPCASDFHTPNCKSTWGWIFWPTLRPSHLMSWIYILRCKLIWPSHAAAAIEKNILIFLHTSQRWSQGSLRCCRYEIMNCLFADVEKKQTIFQGQILSSHKNMRTHSVVKFQSWTPQSFLSVQKGECWGTLFEKRLPQQVMSTQYLPLATYQKASLATMRKFCCQWGCGSIRNTKDLWC